MQNDQSVLNEKCVKKEIKHFLEFIENECKANPVLWGIIKAVVRGYIANVPT